MVLWARRELERTGVLEERTDRTVDGMVEGGKLKGGNMVSGLSVWVDLRAFY